MADDNKKRSLHIYYATPSNDNDQTRVWQATGEHVKLRSHQGGYFTDAYLCSQDIDDTNVQAGAGRGFVTFQIEDGGDEAGKILIDEIRQGRLEVIVEYREHELTQGTGVWENKKAVAVWGYVATARLARGASSIALEVHVFHSTTVNDTLGTRTFSIDCVTGASTIRGGTLGSRQPSHIAPPGTPESGNWGEPISD